MLELRRVSADDARLRQLHAECFPHDDQPDWESGAWWIAFDDRAAAAFAGVQPSVRFAACGYLVRAGVLPSHRGRGLQRRLIRVRERYARAAGWEWLITATLNNPPSANTLARCGYRMYLPKRPWLIDGALYWRKRVSHPRSA